MWGLETIRRINQTSAERARELGLEPVLLETAAQLKDWPPFPIPHLGGACSDVDEDHERVDSLFVDSSGFGADNEPALTSDQFKTRLVALMGEHGSLILAIEDQGQFQLYVVVWKAEVVSGS